MTTKNRLSCSAVGLLLLGCALGASKAEYDKALKSGPSGVPEIKQFLTLFPDSVHMITYYTGTYGKPTWTSTIGLYGRYVITMQMEITFDASREKIIPSTAPEFLLQEIYSIKEEGRNEMVEGANPIAFDREKWKKLVESGGKLEAIGVKTVKDHPVAGFDKHWHTGTGERLSR